MCFPHFADVESRTACWILQKRKPLAVLLSLVLEWDCMLDTTLPSDYTDCEATFQTAVALLTETSTSGSMSR